MNKAAKSYRGAGFFVRQRELVRRRLWPVALTFLSCLLYHVVVTATVLSSVLEESSLSGASHASTLQALRDSVNSLMGNESVSWAFIALPLAALLAIEGFSWMDSRREVDFYESLPVPRVQRFFDICTGSFLYFVFSYLITTEIGLIIANAFGALSRPILMNVLLQAVKTISFFLAVYALGVLSVMLTGNVLVACLAFGTLLIYEPLFRAILQGYASVFLTTWSGSPSPLLKNSLLSPLEYFIRDYSAGKAALCLSGLAVFFLLLSWLCLRLRKNELAGSAVVFRPVRSIVRIAVALIVGLSIGLFFTSIRSNAGIVISVIWIVLFSIITACIMQIIYEYDFRALFHRPLEIAAAVIIALLIFAGFLSDIVGYDRWLPAPDQVTDAALVLTDSSINHCTEEGERVSAEIYGEKYMHLTNVEDVIKIANYGQEFTRKSRNFSAREIMDSSDSTDSREVFSFFVLYRMKNGTTAARRFHLPSTVDPAMMNAVVSTPEYREGFFNIYHDEVVREHAEAFLMEFTNGRDGEFDSMTSEDYEAFRRAYIADLDSFSYTFARYNVPVARVGFSCDRPSAADTYNEYEYIYYSYPVYPSFNSTIRFLKDKGMWAEPLDYEPLLRGNSDYESLSPEDRELYDLTDMSVFTGPFNNSSLQPGN